MLKINKTFVIVFIEYFDYINVFLPKLAVNFLEHTDINNYAIELKKDKQLSYSPIYSLKPIKLETLKACIKSNLANAFIKTFKLPARVPIFFKYKYNRSFCFYIYY